MQIFARIERERERDYEEENAREKEVNSPENMQLSQMAQPWIVM